MLHFSNILLCFEWNRMESWFCNFHGILTWIEWWLKEIEKSRRKRNSVIILLLFFIMLLLIVWLIMNDNILILFPIFFQGQLHKFTYCLLTQDLNLFCETCLHNNLAMNNQVRCWTSKSLHFFEYKPYYCCIERRWIYLRSLQLMNYQIGRSWSLVNRYIVVMNSNSTPFKNEMQK